MLTNLPPYVSIIFQLVGAAAVAYIVYRLLIAYQNRTRGSAAQKRINQLKESIAEQKGIEFGSEKHKIAMAFARYGIDARGREKYAALAARLVVGFVVFVAMVVIARLPILVSLVGFIGGYLVVNGTFEGLWTRTKIEMESELPGFLTGFSSTIQITKDILRAVEDEAAILPPKSPLRLWLLSRLVYLGHRDGIACMEEVLPEAFKLSNGLGTTVYLVKSVWKTGGEQWRHTLTKHAETIANQVSARVNAKAAGEGHRGSVKLIAAVAAIVIAFFARNETLAGALQNPLVQIAYAVIILMMLAGWFFINKMIDEAV